MPFSRAFAAIASLAIVAGLGSIVLRNSTVRVTPTGERIVYFKLTCAENMQAVQREANVIYGPGCLSRFSFQFSTF